MARRLVGAKPLPEPIMMTSSNGNKFRVAAPIWEDDRWIPLTKASDADFWWFLWSAPEQTVE